MKEYTEELKKCKETLEDGKTWGCFGRNAVAFVKSFVSTAYGGIDFDSNFELHQIKTAFGPMVSIRKRITK